MPEIRYRAPSHPIYLYFLSCNSLHFLMRAMGLSSIGIIAILIACASSPAALRFTESVHDAQFESTSQRVFKGDDLLAAVPEKGTIRTSVDSYAEMRSGQCTVRVGENSGIALLGHDTFLLQNGNVLFDAPLSQPLHLKLSTKNITVKGIGFVQASRTGARQQACLIIGSMAEGTEVYFMNHRHYLHAGEILAFAADGQSIHSHFDLQKQVRDSRLLHNFKAEFAGASRIQKALGHFKDLQQRGFIRALAKLPAPLLASTHTATLQSKPDSALPGAALAQVADSLQDVGSNGRPDAASSIALNGNSVTSQFATMMLQKQYDGASDNSRPRPIVMPPLPPLPGEGGLVVIDDHPGTGASGAGKHPNAGDGNPNPPPPPPHGPNGNGSDGQHGHHSH
jgi:hypothetical protein